MKIQENLTTQLPSFLLPLLVFFFHLIFSSLPCNWLDWPQETGRSIPSYIELHCYNSPKLTRVYSLKHRLFAPKRKETVIFQPLECFRDDFMAALGSREEDTHKIAKKPYTLQTSEKKKKKNTDSLHPGRWTSGTLQSSPIKRFRKSWSEPFTSREWCWNPAVHSSRGVPSKTMPIEL